MTGFVYAVESGDAIKIGWTKDPARRTMELNVGSPVKHKLLGYVEASVAQEKELHLLLSRYRIRGEWFENGGPVAAFVAMLTKPNPSLRSRVHSSKLDSYLSQAGMTDVTFAKIICRAPSNVGRIRRGETRPDWDTLERIRDATCGAVTPNDFLPASAAPAEPETAEAAE